MGEGSRARRRAGSRFRLLTRWTQCGVQALRPRATFTMEADHWPEAFRANEHLILESVLTEPLLAVAHEYSIKRALTSRETTSAGAAPGTPSFYGDPLMDTLLDLLQSVAETFTGIELYPTFSDLRVYARGAIVNPHTQRPAGEIALSVSLGFDAPKPWPFFIGTRHGFQTAHLNPGDAILYRAADCPHWRGEFDGEHHVQAFFHYVARRGPNADWKYDRRRVSEGEHGEGR